MPITTNPRMTSSETMRSRGLVVFAAGISGVENGTGTDSKPALVSTKFIIRTPSEFDANHSATTLALTATLRISGDVVHVSLVARETPIALQRVSTNRVKAREIAGDQPVLSKTDQILIGLGRSPSSLPYTRCEKPRPFGPE